MNNYFKAAVFSIQFLTRIPLPVSFETDNNILKKSLIFFPLVGWVLGGILFFLWWLLNATGKFNSLSLAVCIIIAETIITGAFHLDGLADSFDAFLSSGTSKDEKLAIMKDSRIGVMGAVALILCLIFKITLINEILILRIPAALLVFPVAGRWAQVVSYVYSPYVRKGGIGTVFSEVADNKILIAASLFILPCLVLPVFLPALFMLILFLWLYRAYVHRQIGGITGDVLGSITVLSEIMLLFSILLCR